MQDNYNDLGVFTGTRLAAAQRRVRISAMKGWALILCLLIVGALALNWFTLRLETDRQADVFASVGVK